MDSSMETGSSIQPLSEAGSQLTQNTVITSSITVNPRWNLSVNVFFNGNGNSAPTQLRTIQYGQRITTFPGIPSFGMRPFLGWFTTDAQTGGRPVTPGTTIDRDVILGPGMLGPIAHNTNLTLFARWGDGPPPVSLQGFIWPVADGQPNYFGGRAFITGHLALDISNENDVAGFPRWTPLPAGTHTPSGFDASRTGARVVAAREGVILHRFRHEDSPARTTGNGFVIAHPNGLFTRYLHLHDNDFRNLSRGTSVGRGALLGLTGQTGNTVQSNGHLHIEFLRCQDRSGFRAEDNASFFAASHFGGQGALTYDVPVGGRDYRFERLDPLSFLPLNNLAPNRL